MTTTKTELLKRARAIALQLAQTNGTVTADDVAKRLDDPLGPLAGSVFKTPDFEFTGERVRSTQKNNHSRELKVWRLTPTGVKNAKQSNEPITTSPGLAPSRRPPYAETTPLPRWLT
jgi:hypothetical protein